MMHCTPCFRFPPAIFDKFSDSVENFQHFTFSRKISRFSSAKFSDDLFFSRRPQISNFPLFSLFQYIPPYFAKIIISPLLSKISPPVLKEFTCFLHTLYVFRFPPTFTMMHLCIT